MAIDSVEATGGLQGGGSTGDVTVRLDPPVSRQNGGTGVSVVTATQLVNQLGALPTSGGHMSGDLTVHTGLVVGDPLDGNLGAGTVNIKNLLQVNAGTAPAATMLPGTHLHVEGDDNARILLTAWSGDATFLLRSSKGTGAAPVQLNTGEPLGIIGFGGYTDAGWAAAPARKAGVTAVALQQWTNSPAQTGCRLEFETTALNASSPVARMKLERGLVVDETNALADMGAGSINAQAVYIQGSAVASGGAGLPMEGGTLSNTANVTAAADLLTVRSSTTVAQSNQIIFDQPNTNNGAQVWRVGPGAGGSFGIYDQTAGGNPKFAINKMTGQVQFQNGNLNLDDATGMQFIFRTVGVGSRKIGIATDATTPLEELYINADDVIMTDNLEVGGTTVPSDRRLKQNVEPWRRGLDEVRQLNPISFEYNGVGGLRADGRMRIGLDAEETGEIIPEMVGTRRSGHKTIAPDTLIYTLINSVKELAARLEALEGRR